jgi:hypothetical protein
VDEESIHHFQSTLLDILVSTVNRVAGLKGYNSLPAFIIKKQTGFFGSQPVFTKIFMARAVE